MLSQAPQLCDIAYTAASGYGLTLNTSKTIIVIALSGRNSDSVKQELAKCVGDLTVGPPVHGSRVAMVRKSKGLCTTIVDGKGCNTEVVHRLSQMRGEFRHIQGE
eukprot:1637554-Pyramimonas_sp.AAC.1